MPVLAVIAAYLIGSVPFALILARRWGVADLRLVGSGNLGAANVLRASGMTAGLLVAVLDIGKGAAGVLLAEAAGRRRRRPPRRAWPRSSDMCIRCGCASAGAKASPPRAACSPCSRPSRSSPAFAVFLAGVWAHAATSRSARCSRPWPCRRWPGQPAARRRRSASRLPRRRLVVFRHRSNLARLRDGTRAADWSRAHERTARSPCSARAAGERRWPFI